MAASDVKGIFDPNICYATVLPADCGDERGDDAIAGLGNVVFGVLEIAGGEISTERSAATRIAVRL